MSSFDTNIVDSNSRGARLHCSAISKSLRTAMSEVRSMDEFYFPLDEANPAVRSDC